MHGVDTVLNVIGSVALLLWGVRMVRTGLTRAFGAALRRAIAACARNRFTAFLGGIAITGLLQSSTATALLVSSFAGRGLIPLSIAFAVMLGAEFNAAIQEEWPAPATHALRLRWWLEEKAESLNGNSTADEPLERRTSSSEEPSAALVGMAVSGPSSSRVSSRPVPMNV